MRAIFRVDASDSIGTGHVMRCLSLAEVLRRRGVECVFLSRQSTGNMHATVIKAGFEQCVLPGQDIFFAGNDCEESAQDALQDDVRSTIRAIAGRHPEWLIVDHYAINAEWERLLRPHVGSILVIDDLANRSHDCDVLLDQNFNPQGELRYAQFVRVDTRLLCGPRYALLQSEFAKYRATLARDNSTCLRAFVSFGGSDTDNLTGLAIKAFQTPDLSDIALDVAIGCNNPHRRLLEHLIFKRAGAQAHFAPESLAPLMANADLAVGAGGTTTWERVCLDLPSIVVGMADNQLAACESLHAAGRIDYVSPAANLKLGELRKAIERVVGSLNSGQVGAAEPLVDGLGAERVAEVMAPSAIGTYVIRPAKYRDIDSFYFWANDPGATMHAPANAPESWDEHQRNFEGTLASEVTVMLVLESHNLPIGYVSFDISKSHVLLKFALDSIAWGRGLKPTFIRKGLEQLSRCRPIILPKADHSDTGNSTSLPVRVGSNADHLAKRRVGLEISMVSDPDSWINDPLVDLYLGWLEDGHEVSWCHDIGRVSSGDLCFYLSCGQMASGETLARFKNNLVVHESDLPLGRGWSPLSWQISGGSSSVAVTLFEASITIDSGDIYAQQFLHFGGTELVNELRAAQVDVTIGLCRDFVRDYPGSAKHRRPQEGEGTRYRRRTPSDSALDPNLSLARQFDLLRIIDNDRYPATLSVRGSNYRITINRNGE